jgi:hypothetical protein
VTDFYNLVIKKSAERELRALPKRLLLDPLNPREIGLLGQPGHRLNQLITWRLITRSNGLIVAPKGAVVVPWEWIRVDDRVLPITSRKMVEIVAGPARHCVVAGATDKLVHPLPS